MAGGITKIYDSLKSELNKAENELKSVDKDLKKLVGGSDDAFDKTSSNLRKNDSSNRARVGRNYFDDKKFTSSSRSNEMVRKRKLSDSSSSRIFSRLDKKLDDDRGKRPSLQSTIVTTPTAIKFKQENAVDPQKDKELDRKNTARNRRMFGMINMTLQKFQNEETQRKNVTTKREEIEKKLDLAVAEEKQAVEQEKLSLIKSKRDKQNELKNIELKMDRVEIHQQWSKSNQYLTNFIQTKAKPHIFFMPNKLTPENEKRLKETKDKYLIILAEKRAKIQKEIENLTKKDELRKENLSSIVITKSERQDKLKNGDDIKGKSELKEDEKLNLKNDIEDGEYNSNDTDLNNDNHDQNEKLINHKEQVENDKGLLKEENDLEPDDRLTEDLNKSNNELMEEDLNQKESNELIDNQSTDKLINSIEKSNDNSNQIANCNLNVENSVTDSKKTTENKLEDKEFEPIYDE